MTIVARENVRQALFVEHRERLLQAAQEIRGRRVGEIKSGIGLEHRPPVPIGADQLRRPGRVERARADGVEGQARREHQPLLAPGDGDVHAPLVVPVVDRSQRRDRVDEQQRGMSGPVDRSPDSGDRADAAGRGLVMNDADRADLFAFVGFERGLDRGRIGAASPVGLQKDRLESKALRHFAPERCEPACARHQNRVARRQRIDERGFPRARAGGGKDDHRDRSSGRRA